MAVVKEATPRLAPGRRGSGWIIASSLALLATARWLSATSVEYVVLGATATAIAGALVSGRARPNRGWAVASLAALALALAVAASTQTRLARLERDWPAERTRMRREALDDLERVVSGAATDVATLAARALEPPAPRDRAGGFERLTALAGGDDPAVVLFHERDALAWSGEPRVPMESLSRPIGVTATQFYLALYAARAHGADRAVASRLLFAVPPADRLAGSLADDVARRAVIRGFRFSPVAAGDTSGEARRLIVNGEPLFTATAESLTQGEVQVRLLERARLLLGLLLGASLACFVVAGWRGTRALRWRAAMVGVGLLVVALTPLSAFSNFSRLFDPSLYFTPLGGPLTANAAALALTSALVLLLLLAGVRRQARLRNRWIAAGGVLLVAVLGPFLLRDLARGIQIPLYGVSASLWLTWEVPLFLAAVSVILTGAVAGSAALGGSRGLPPWVAPALAAIAALIAPVVWQAPGQFPWWYTFLWIAAIASLAVSRRTAAIVGTAAAVAALGATTLVWANTTRARVRLAEQDVRTLGGGDVDARALAERLSRDLAESPAFSRPELLRLYAASDLAAAGFPVWLAAWREAEPAFALATASFSVSIDSLRSVVRRVASDGTPRAVELPGNPAVAHAIVAPTDSGALTIVVAPKSRLIPADPFARLLGIEAPPETEPPYTLQLAPLSLAPAFTRPAWRRQGSELHGEWVAHTGVGPARVHAEVELRPLTALVQRGTLIALLDLAIVALLWLTSIVADGIAARWIAVRQRRWARSFRMRLTLALFGFFMIPAIAFAVWSYQQLSTDAARARELLVRETLRAVTPTDTSGEWLARESRRLGTPLLLYRAGRLVAASDTLLHEIAPVGRRLQPDVADAMLVQGEVTAQRVERVGGTRTLFGYRAAELASGEMVVLSAPARADELSLGRRARDLGILVLFATAIGALAALGLSGIAARQLARPIGSLRKAALALAGGEREPELEGEPTAEFLPVFAAFRRMMSDLNASRSALEEAQRRTAAVLRNAASGVIAVDDAGVVTLANPRADELLGARLPPGTRLADVGPPELARVVERFLAGGGDDEAFEMPFHEQQWRGRLTRLTRGGAVVTVDDVSEIARAERVLAWGEMARQVAHEIKNPLTPIRLGVQHLRRARTDRRVDFDRVLEQNVERILREIDRLDEIARAFSRYGQPPEQRGGAESTDVAAVLRDLVDLETMGEEHVQWTLRGDRHPVHALARREELREVLLNVFENARLARASEVTASLHRDGEGREGRVAITVHDNGQGIPADVLPRIFEPHFSTRTSGSGLGLAISRRLIESWGGTIEIESAPGRGTRVEIRLLGA